MRLPAITPTAYRRMTGVALVALAFIVVTGAAVRLTGSGLGCSDWPGCESDRFVPALETHELVEGVNRLITGLVSVAVALAVLGSYARTPRRRDLTLLSLGLVVGVVAQIVLGGITVLFHLWPPLVMAHFAVSMLLVADATVLHHRAGAGAELGRPVIDAPIVAPEVGVLGRLLVAAAALVLVTGTVVTGSGPHGGDENADRLPFYVPEVARIHGVSVVLFLAATLLFVWLVRRTHAPAAVHARATILLAAIGAQAVVGYVQYFTDVPPLLVGIHVAGATVVWWATLSVLLSLRAPVVQPQLAPAVAVG